MKTFIKIAALFLVLVIQPAIASDGRIGTIEDTENKTPIRISHPNGGAKYIYIDRDTSFGEFKDLILNAYMDYEKYWVSCSAKVISWENTDPVYGKEIMNHIMHHNSIILLFRVEGGSNIINKLSEKIKEYSLEELFPNDGRCSLCFDETSKVSNFSCGCHYCNECFTKVFKIFSIEGNKNCPTHREHDLIGETVNLVITLCEEEVIECYVKFVNYLELTKYMNCKLCKCDTLVVNTTGYSKQFCEVCNEEVCFYCGESWNKNKQNVIGYCCSNCDNYSRLVFEQVNWPRGVLDDGRTPNSLLKIPGSRFCPGCGIHGGFDEKCKYHKCKCGLTFCFFCLNSETQCKAQYGKTCYQKCMEPIPQDLSVIFRKNRL